MASLISEKGKLASAVVASCSLSHRTLFSRFTSLTSEVKTMSAINIKKISRSIAISLFISLLLSPVTGGFSFVQLIEEIGVELIIMFYFDR